MPSSPIYDAGLPSAHAEVEESATRKSDRRGAMLRTAATMSCAALFGVGLGAMRGRKAAFEFAAGYLVEQSLSVDNLFVFIMLFSYFKAGLSLSLARLALSLVRAASPPLSHHPKVPIELQDRVLSWGIIGAVLMRGVMIGAGVAAVHRFRWMTLLFAAILLVSAVKLLLDDDDADDLAENMVLRISKRLVGATSEYDGARFLTTDMAGRRAATPLLLCLVCIELSDFVFAVDRPAVLGVSTDGIVLVQHLRDHGPALAVHARRARRERPAVPQAAVALRARLHRRQDGARFFDVRISTQASLAVVVLLLGGGAPPSSRPARTRARRRAPGARVEHPPPQSPPRASTDEKTASPGPAEVDDATMGPISTDRMRARARRPAFRTRSGRRYFGDERHLASPRCRGPGAKNPRRSASAGGEEDPVAHDRDALLGPTVEPSEQLARAREAALRRNSVGCPPSRCERARPRRSRARRNRRAQTRPPAPRASGGRRVCAAMRSRASSVARNGGPPAAGPAP